MTAPDLAAIRAGTDAISRNRAFPHLPFHRGADIPPEEDVIALADYQDAVSERHREHDADDRTLTDDDPPPGYCPRWWKASL